MSLDERGPKITANDLNVQRRISLRAFGPGHRSKGIIEHIRKELEEIEAEPLDLEEWVDVLILALDGAWRAGWHAEEIIRAYHAKVKKNSEREWPDWRTVGQDKAIEHDRSGE